MGSDDDKAETYSITDRGKAGHGGRNGNSGQTPQRHREVFGRECDDVSSLAEGPRRYGAPGISARQKCQAVHHSGRSRTGEPDPGLAIREFASSPACRGPSPRKSEAGGRSSRNRVQSTNIWTQLTARFASCPAESCRAIISRGVGERSDKGHRSALYFATGTLRREGGCVKPVARPAGGGRPRRPAQQQNQTGAKRIPARPDRGNAA
jgi:hypothetical protein